VSGAISHRERLRIARKLLAACHRQASLLLHGQYVAADRLRRGVAGKKLLCTDVYRLLEVVHKVYSQDGKADIGEQELVLQGLVVNGDCRCFLAPAPNACIVRTPQCRASSWSRGAMRQYAE
jgi:hypothetical protein